MRPAMDPDPALVAEEKRLTRARRAVEKAVAACAAPDPPVAVADGGPSVRIELAQSTSR